MSTDAADDFWYRGPVRWWLHKRWTNLTINWFTVALHCRVHGHAWRTNRVATLELTDCGWCGKFGGSRRLDGARSVRYVNHPAPGTVPESSAAAGDL